MAHNFPVPDEVQLGKLIVSVYKRTPVPVISRLNRIEERLSRKLATGKPKLQRDVNKIPWWIVLLLAGGFATAAWWAGERLYYSQKPVTPHEKSIEEMGKQTEHPGSDSTGDDGVTGKGDEQEDLSRFQKETPVIYQREAY